MIHSIQKSIRACHKFMQVESNTSRPILPVTHTYLGFGILFSRKEVGVLVRSSRHVFGINTKE